ncbi:Integral membrane protein [Colletotrichum sp. SAR 10_99]|nr:Integral membrane protein [Colletotrichum sp. SAR 10_99]
MANSNDDNSDFTRRKDRLFAEYTAFFADNSRPEDTACRLQLDALENLLKGFKDDNMNNTYLQETCNFLSHPWSKLDPSLSSLLDWDKRSVLLERIEATASQNFAEFYTPDRFTPRASTKYVSMGRRNQTFLSHQHNTLRPLHHYEETRKRDGAKCVIMKSGVGQIAHAFAYSAIKHKGRLDSPLDALASVYGPEKIAAIRAALGGNLDVPANVVYLNYVPHQLWDKVRLGFRPIERLFNHEGIVNGIRLRLFVFSKSKLHKEYLPKFQWKPSLVQDLSEIFEESDSSLDFLMVSSKTQRIIRNGYEFDITADDPKYAPNWDIYDLMWRLSLMGVILGAGEVPDQTVPEPKQDPDGQLAPISQDPETDAVIEAVIDRLEDIVNQSDGAKEDTAS